MASHWFDIAKRLVTDSREACHDYFLALQISLLCLAVVESSGNQSSSDPAYRFKIFSKLRIGTYWTLNVSYDNKTKTKSVEER